MRARRAVILLFVLGVATASTAPGAEKSDWWNPRWRKRTTVVRPTPCRDQAPRPVEVAIDLPLLLKQAGVAGRFDAASVRVIERGGRGDTREVPFALRSELKPDDGIQNMMQTERNQHPVAKAEKETADITGARNPIAGRIHNLLERRPKPSCHYPDPHGA